jgi:hypothetical protein
VSPELLATRREIEALVLGEPDPAVLLGWRRHAIGARLLALLDEAKAQPAPAARRNSE